MSPKDFGTASCRALVQAVAGRSRPAIGLATGNTPRGLYLALRTEAEAGRVAVGPWRPFAIDEYVCEPDHPCANRAFFERHWDPIPGASPVVQFEAGASSLTAEPARFAAALHEAGGLDVAVLGIGTNGHLAFNEPGARRGSTSRLVALTAASRMSAARCFREAPTQGLTLGLAELLGARQVLLLANGTAKAVIVARAMEGPIGTDCPASFVRQHPAATVVLDERAASLLARGPL